MNLIELQPDDVLVLRCPGVLTKDQRDAAFTSLRLFIGPDRKVLILDGDQALDVIRVSLSGKVETNDIVRHADEQSSWGNWQDPDGAQRAAHRKEYNALSPEEREPYGNFMGFVADKGGRDPYAREVQHLDTDEPEAEGIPPHVWLYRNMLTDLQALAPLGRDETNGQYAVAIDELTVEQRAIPHVAIQLAVVLKHGRNVDTNTL